MVSGDSGSFSPVFYLQTVYYLNLGRKIPVPHDTGEIFLRIFGFQKG